MASHVGHARRRRDPGGPGPGRGGRSVGPWDRTGAMLQVAVGLIVLTMSCGGGSSTEPGFDDDADVRVLFVGNSLTYANDLPRMVEMISSAVGASVSTVTIARADYALEDHWAAGIAERIRVTRPTVVVMQQGPSSLPESRVNLVQWTDSVARVAREVGAVPASLMVWPEAARAYAFDAVRDSYRAAAEHVGGIFVPAGEAFRALYERYPGFQPYGPDGFHPSQIGSIVSALVVVRTLTGQPLAGLPPVLDGGNRTPRIDLSGEQARVLTHVADSVADAWAGTARSAVSPSASADRAAILAIYERTRAAHFDEDPEEFLAPVDSAYWVVSSGGVRHRDKAEALRELKGYFREATFTDVQDVVPPRITVAPSGDVAWLIGQVEVRGESVGGDTIAFLAAWLDLYQKRRGLWRLVVHANTQRDLPADTG